MTIVATDIDGIATTEHIRDLKLVDEREFVHEMAVPARLASLTVSLSGTLRTLRGNDLALSTDARTFTINGEDASATTFGSQVVRTVGGYAIELRGKNGEPKPNRAVAVKLWHPDFRITIDQRLRTDAKGRIELGPLTGFDVLQFDAGESPQAIDLRTANVNLPESLHGLAGETLRVPYVAPVRNQRGPSSRCSARTMMSSRIWPSPPGSSNCATSPPATTNCAFTHCSARFPCE